MNAVLHPTLPSVWLVTSPSGKTLEVVRLDEDNWRCECGLAYFSRGELAPLNGTTLPCDHLQAVWASGVARGGDGERVDSYMAVGSSDGGSMEFSMVSRQDEEEDTDNVRQ